MRTVFTMHGTAQMQGKWGSRVARKPHASCSQVTRVSFHSLPTLSLPLQPSVYYNYIAISHLLQTLLRIHYIKCNTLSVHLIL